MMLSTSLKSYTEIKSPVFHLFPERIRWENYVELFQSGRWGRYFLNSFTITAISTAAAVIINSMAGYAFARLHFKGRDTLFGIALLGMIVPAQVTMLPDNLCLIFRILWMMRPELTDYPDSVLM